VPICLGGLIDCLAPIGVKLGQQFWALLIMGMIFGQGHWANALCYQGRELTSQRKLWAIHPCIQQRPMFKPVVEGDRSAYK
jgi:hypothetical protein